MTPVLQCAPAPPWSAEGGRVVPNFWTRAFGSGSLPQAYPQDGNGVDIKPGQAERIFTAKIRLLKDRGDNLSVMQLFWDCGWCSLVVQRRSGSQ